MHVSCPTPSVAAENLGLPHHYCTESVQGAKSSVCQVSKPFSLPTLFFNLSAVFGIIAPLKSSSALL